MALKVEPGDDVRPFVCVCCGEPFQGHYGSVTEDGVVRARYLAAFFQEGAVCLPLLIIMPDWGKHEEVVLTSINVHVWPSEESYNVNIVDVAACPWPQDDSLGRMIDRAEALKHPYIDIYFHMTDHIMLEDPAVKAFLDGPEVRGGHDHHSSG